MKNFSAQSWQIEHQCPQCGAPVILEETDRILLCGYCRTRLYLSCVGHFRYLLPPSRASSVLPEDLLFIPYWRFRGAVYSFRANGMDQRMVDSSLLALNLKCLPPTLGLRPQTLKLRFATPQTVGEFLAPQFPFKKPARTPPPDIPDGFPTGEESPPVLFETFVGDTLSVIYSPVYIRGDTFYDAILNRPAASMPAGGFSCLPACRGSDTLIRFFSTLCPACGWDLEGDKETLVLLCRNCTSAWKSSGNGLKKIDSATVAGEGDSSCYLPFWQLRADITGPVALHSYADLIRSANLPKAIRREWHDRELSFWIPAFKVQPHLFLRLARSLTVMQPPEELLEALPGKQVYPVTLPMSEAVESIPPTIASFAVPRHLILPRIPDIRVAFKSSLLVYLPFALQGEEFIHHGMQLSINRNALKLGKLL